MQRKRPGNTDTVRLFEGDRVYVQIGEVRWECRVHASTERCAVCDGLAVRIDPPWETWQLLCPRESALTTTPAEYMKAIANLPKGAIGVVSSIPVHIAKEDG